MSPTQRTLKHCRDCGYLAEVVERWNPHAKVRHDLIGCIDVLVIGECRTLGIQACAGASHNARLEKALAEPRLVQWLRANREFEVWSWQKRGAAGKRKLWSLRQTAVRLVDDKPVAQTSDLVDGVVMIVQRRMQAVP